MQWLCHQKPSKSKDEDNLRTEYYLARRQNQMHEIRQHSRLQTLYARENRNNEKIQTKQDNYDQR